MNSIRTSGGVLACACAILLLRGGPAALAQNPQLGHIERNGSDAVLTVESPRPVDSAALTLAHEFGIRINVEDPPYVFEGDMNDVTASVSRDSRRPVRDSKGRAIENRFSART